MNTIGKIKFPKSADISGLYIQCNEAVSIEGQEGNKKAVLSQGGMLSSSSYFNSFYEKYYVKYTTIRSIDYLLKLEGDFKVSVYREASEKTGREMISEEKFANCQLSNSVKLSIALLEDNNAGRIYIEIICLGEQGVFEGGWIVTDEQKSKEVSLAIVICTFKKEDYIANTLDAIFQDEFLRDKNFSVFVIDNGRTLDKANISDPRLRLISNKNAGGSGGFTRGLVEALEEDIYSHFLLMDDDIELESESICRLFALHEYAKSDFAIAGGLLNLQKKHVLYEAGARYSEDAKTRGFAPGSLTALNHNIDLQTTDSLNQLLIEEDTDYGGFWFFSFSREIVDKIKLPLPLFIKIDDIEFCLRIKRFLSLPIVTFPSIAVWHQPASAKNLNWETYYYARNDLITYAIHFAPQYIPTVSHLTKAITQSLLKSDLDRAHMLIKAFEDYLKGADFLKDSDPETLHQSILKLSRSYENQTKADHLAATKLCARWVKVVAKSSIEWQSISEGWKSASAELTSTAFWRKYLAV